MATPKYHSVSLAFICTALFSGAVFAAEKGELDKYKVMSEVNDCFTATPKKLISSQGLTILSAGINNIKSVGYCGCKSAMLSYSVYSLENVEDHAIESLIGYGVFSSKGKKSINFMVNADSGVKYDVVKVAISCKGPD